MNEFEKHIQSNVYTMTDRAIVLYVTKKTDWTLQDILDALPSYHSQNSLKNYLTKFFTQEEIEKHAIDMAKDTKHTPKSAQKPEPKPAQEEQTMTKTTSGMSSEDLFATIRKLAENYDKDYIRHVKLHHSVRTLQKIKKEP